MNIIKILKTFWKADGLTIDENSYLNLVDHDIYKFNERGRSVIVWIERGYSGYKTQIHTDSIRKWLPPHEDEEISSEEKKRIARKIGTLFDRLEQPWVMDLLPGEIDLQNKANGKD